MQDNVVYLKVSRSSVLDKEKRISEFEVPYDRAMTVLSMLRYVHRYIDPTLAFRDFRCGRGVCFTCRVRVNKKVRKMCETPITAGSEVLLEPAPGKVIKDLVIEF